MSLLFYMFKFVDTNQNQTIDIQTFTGSEEDDIIDQVVHFYGDLYEKYSSITGRNISIEMLSGTELTDDPEQSQNSRKLGELKQDVITNDLNDQVQELLDRIEQQDGDSE